LCGESGGKIYRLSDRLRVRVVRVDLDDKKIDFELV
jgi:ribonuclease R